MQLSELILTYERHPDLFVEDLLGVTPQDWQRDSGGAASALDTASENPPVHLGS